MSYPLYGNVIIDSSNGTALGGTLTISNSCNTSVLNNRASIAFAVADISYGTLNRGLFSGGVDSADVRITAIVDTVSPTVGTGLSVSVSPNHVNPPVEALRVRSNGNVGIGTQTPEFTLDVNGNVGLNAINLQTSTGQTSTQLGFSIRNTLTAAAPMSSANTWLEPPGQTGRITLPSQGVYLLSYSFSTRTFTVLMGCLSESDTAPYATPQTTDGTGVLCFSGSVNTAANWISCSNTIVYVNTTPNRIIYLWWASQGAATIKTYGNYFHAVRIA